VVAVVVVVVVGVGLGCEINETAPKLSSPSRDLTRSHPSMAHAKARCGVLWTEAAAGCGSWHGTPGRGTMYPARPKPPIEGAQGG
jgi:hypothetical protein